MTRVKIIHQQTVSTYLSNTQFEEEVEDFLEELRDKNLQYEIHFSTTVKDFCDTASSVMIIYEEP